MARFLTLAAGAVLVSGTIIGFSMGLHPASAGGARDGQAIYKAKCAVCHATTRTGGTTVGPRLYGVVGRKAGTLPDHKYSAAMKNSGIVWTETNLKRFIANPSSVVPGNHMPYAGDRKPAEVGALVSYLKTLR